MVMHEYVTRGNRCDVFLPPLPQYFTCLLLILIAQIAAGALIYFKKDAVSHLLPLQQFTTQRTAHAQHPGSFLHYSDSSS